MSASPFLRCSHVDFSYRHHKRVTEALHNITFELLSGKSLALCGSNGAGKSTLLRVITGLIMPNSGSVEFALPELDSPLTRLANIACVSREFKLEPYLRVEQELNFIARAHQWEHISAAPFFDFLNQRLQVNQLFAKKVSSLSTGQQQRLSLFAALIHQPRFVVFDEPTTGLDMQSCASFHELVYELRRSGVSLIVATHSLSEVKSLCDDVLFLHQGHILFNCSVTEFINERASLTESYAQRIKELSHA